MMFADILRARAYAWNGSKQPVKVMSTGRFTVLLKCYNKEMNAALSDLNPNGVAFSRQTERAVPTAFEIEDRKI